MEVKGPEVDLMKWKVPPAPLPLPSPQATASIEKFGVLHWSSTPWVRTLSHHYKSSCPKGLSAIAALYKAENYLGCSVTK
jgi:hypothetical protein